MHRLFAVLRGAFHEVIARTDEQFLDGFVVIFIFHVGFSNVVVFRDGERRGS